MSVKNRVYRLLDKPEPDDRLGIAVDWFILVLISLSVVTAILETVESIKDTYSSIFWVFEVITIIVFSIEYVLRIWSCTSNPEFSHPVFGRIRYAFTSMALIDLIAILPFYLPFLVALDLRYIRVLRVMRVFRLLKIGRYSKAISESIRVIRSRKAHLIITLTMTIILLVLISGVMYVIEREAQPDVFASIPDTMWWTVCTMTTVGYGDVYPITPLGKILAGLISLLGVGLFAVPAGIISSGFYDVMRTDKCKTSCPHCGKAIED